MSHFCPNVQKSGVLAKLFNMRRVGNTRALHLNSNCPTSKFKLSYYDGNNLLMCPPRTDPGLS